MPQLSQYDPLDVAATDAEIRAMWLEILQMPVAANDGKVFQFDLNSERLMKKSLIGWDAASITTMDWRLNDNTEVNVTKAQLQTYFDELELNGVIRGYGVDLEFVAHKANGATKRDLVNWKASYVL